MSRDERTLFVSNLHDDVTEELLKELFVQVSSALSFNYSFSLLFSHF